VQRALALVVIALVGCGGERPTTATDAAIETTPAPSSETVNLASGIESPSTPQARRTGTPLPGDCSGSQAADDVAAADAPGATLEQRIASVVPTPEEDKFLSVPWRTNLMAAREEAQDAAKPVFLWIMVGNPQGCT
jgi:hypothetical protein